MGEFMSVDSSPDTPKTVFRSTFAFLSGTFLSRLSGLGRDATMAIAFGSNPAIAAFMVAFRFSNLIRRLFGEGPMSSGFIPHFEQMRSISNEKGAQFFRDLFFSLSLFLILLIAGIEVILLSVLKWGQLQPDNAQILHLTILMLPGILFICLFGLSSGLLQCERRFFMTGFAPVAFNLIWIAATLFLKKRDPSYAVFPLSLAIIAAFFMQWAMLAPQTFFQIKRFLTWRECFSPQLFSPSLRQMVKPLLWSVIGVAAVQINTTLDAVFARYASLEGPAYLWYAIRIEQVPLALFGIALSTALLPPLTRAIKDGAYDLYLKLLRFALKRSFSLILPCTMGIFAGINLLYGHGDFSMQATYQTAICLWGYGLGLLPSVFVLLLAPAFYADKEFRTPMMASVFSVAVNILLTFLFVFIFKWGAFSISIATSISAWVNYVYLSYYLSKKIGEPLFDITIFASFLKTGVCALIATAVTVFVGKFFVDDPTLRIFFGEAITALKRDFAMQLMQFAGLGGTFVLIFFSYAWMLNAEDVLELIGLKRKPAIESVAD
jgi:putative peptidoglycan lipid II flippase